jgi:MFS family permease
MVGAVVSGAALMPRTGPRPLISAGALLSAIGLALLTRIDTDTTYVATVLPSLLIMGLGFGLIFGPVQNAATSGVTDSDAGVASAMVSTAQQIGGSIGTAVFSSLAALTATSYVTSHGADQAAAATIASYHLVFWVAAAVFTATAIGAVLLFPSGPIPDAPQGRQAPTV